MNPYSRFLSRNQRDESLQRFIVAWDAIEALAIGVYKSGRADAEAEHAYAALRPRLATLYEIWREPLSRYWPETLVGGTPATVDPFAALLDVASAAGFADNWTALQQLPAAREAINRLLVDVSGAT